MDSPSNTPSSTPPKRLSIVVWVAVAVTALVGAYRWTMTAHRGSDAPSGPSAVAWQTDFPAALAESAKTGQPVLLDFSAEWCPPCQEMKRSVWTDAGVGKAVAAHYIPVAVDVDGNPDVAQRYGIQQIPTILIVNAQGEVLHRGAFMSPEQMISFLNRNAG